MGNCLCSGGNYSDHARYWLEDQKFVRAVPSGWHVTVIRDDAGAADQVMIREMACRNLAPMQTLPPCGEMPQDDFHRIECPNTTIQSGCVRHADAHWQLPTDDAHTVVGRLEALRFTCSGLFVDGSGGKHTTKRELRRCGTVAMAMLHDELCCPDARQTAPRAELAVVLWLLAATESQGGQSVRAHIQAPTFLGGKPRLSSHANLWTRFDAAWDGLVFIKVPAHTNYTTYGRVAHLSTAEDWKPLQ